MTDRQIYRLVHDVARARAVDAIKRAPMGMVVEIKPATRTLDQNAKFHSAVADIAKARPEWNGLRMDAEDWKALLILSHAIATGGSDGQLRMVPDLEGKGFVQLRESSARMTKERSSSLIEYTIAWAVSHGIPLHDSESRADSRDGASASASKEHDTDGADVLAR